MGKVVLIIVVAALEGFVVNRGILSNTGRSKVHRGSSS
jgi:hypothetical protein